MRVGSKGGGGSLEQVNSVGVLAAVLNLNATKQAIGQKQHGHGGDNLQASGQDDWSVQYGDARAFGVQGVPPHRKGGWEAVDDTEGAGATAPAPLVDFCGRAAYFEARKGGPVSEWASQLRRNVGRGSGRWLPCVVCLVAVPAASAAGGTTALPTRLPRQLALAPCPMLPRLQGLARRARRSDVRLLHGRLLDPSRAVGRRAEALPGAGRVTHRARLRPGVASSHRPRRLAPNQSRVSRRPHRGPAVHGRERRPSSNAWLHLQRWQSRSARRRRRLVIAA